MTPVRPARQSVYASPEGVEEGRKATSTRTACSAMTANRTAWSAMPAMRADDGGSTILRSENESIEAGRGVAPRPSGRPSGNRRGAGARR